MKTGKTRQIPRAVIMLGLVSLLTDAASEMIYPLVPVYIAALGSGAIVLGLIEGVAETTAALLKLFSGILSDRLGRRKMLVLAGYTISSLVRPLTGLVTSSWQIILVRMTDRVGKGIRTAPRDALIASAAGEENRGKAFGFHRAMDHAGAVAGPLLAISVLLVLLSVFHVRDPLRALRLTFLFAIVPGLLAVAVIIFFVKENAGSPGRSSRFRLLSARPGRNFRNYLLVLILFTLGNSSDAFMLFRVGEAIRGSGAVAGIVSDIPFLDRMLDSFGDEQTKSELVNILFLPLVWAFFHIIKVIFSTPLGALSDRTGRKKVIIAGWLIYSLVYFSFALLVFLTPEKQVVATFVLFAVYALYYAFTEGAEKAFVADLVTEDKRGTAFGLYSLSTGLGALPASILFGFLYSEFDGLWPGYGGTVAFGAGGLIALVSAFLLSSLVRESRGAE